MLIRSRTRLFVLVLLCAAALTPAVVMTTPEMTPTAMADCEGADCGGGDSGGGGWYGPTISFGGGYPCYPGRLGLCLGRLNGPIPGAALRPVPPPGPAPRVGPRGTWP